MGLAAAAAGKRKAAPAASYVEEGGASSEDDDEYVAPVSSSKKAKLTPATGADQKKSKSVTAAAAANKPPKAPNAAAEIKGVVAKLSVLDRTQLAGLVKALIESGAVAPSQVDGLLPAPDMGAYVKEGERLCAAIRRALPNSRWGSCTDHFGYKRCASANNACKKYIVDHAKNFKSAKQWQAAREYAIAMLPVARGMVDFDLPDDCKARNATIDALSALKAEAEKHLGILPAAATAAPKPPAAGPSSAPAVPVPVAVPELAD